MRIVLFFLFAILTFLVQGCGGFKDWIGRGPAYDRSVESVTSYAHQLTISFKGISLATAHKFAWMTRIDQHDDAHQDDIQMNNSDLMFIFTMCLHDPKKRLLEESGCDQLEFLDNIPDDIGDDDEFSPATSVKINYAPMNKRYLHILWIDAASEEEKKMGSTSIFVNPLWESHNTMETRKVVAIEQDRDDSLDEEILRTVEFEISDEVIQNQGKQAPKLLTADDKSKLNSRLQDHLSNKSLKFSVQTLSKLIYLYNSSSMIDRNGLNVDGEAGNFVDLVCPDNLYYKKCTSKEKKLIFETARSELELYHEQEPNNPTLDDGKNQVKKSLRRLNTLLRQMNKYVVTKSRWYWKDKAIHDEEFSEIYQEYVNTYMKASNTGIGMILMTDYFQKKVGRLRLQGLDIKKSSTGYYQYSKHTTYITTNDMINGVEEIKKKLKKQIIEMLSQRQKKRSSDQFIKSYRKQILSMSVSEHSFPTFSSTDSKNDPAFISYNKQRNKDVQNLMRANSITIRSVLLDHPELGDMICEHTLKLAKKMENRQKWNKRFLYGGLGIGAGLVLVPFVGPAISSGVSAVTFAGYVALAGLTLGIAETGYWGYRAMQNYKEMKKFQTSFLAGGGGVDSIKKSREALKEFKNAGVFAALSLGSAFIDGFTLLHSIKLAKLSKGTYTFSRSLESKARVTKIKSLSKTLMKISKDKKLSRRFIFFQDILKGKTNQLIARISELPENVSLIVLEQIKSIPIRRISKYSVDEIFEQVINKSYKAGLLNKSECLMVAKGLNRDGITGLTILKKSSAIVKMQRLGIDNTKLQKFISIHIKNKKSVGVITEKLEAFLNRHSGSTRRLVSHLETLPIDRFKPGQAGGLEQTVNFLDSAIARKGVSGIDEAFDVVSDSRVWRNLTDMCEYAGAKHKKILKHATNSKYKNLLTGVTDQLEAMSRSIGNRIRLQQKILKYKQSYNKLMRKPLSGYNTKSELITDLNASILHYSKVNPNFHKLKSDYLLKLDIFIGNMDKVKFQKLTKSNSDLGHICQVIFKTSSKGAKISKGGKIISAVKHVANKSSGLFRKTLEAAKKCVGKGKGCLSDFLTKTIPQTFSCMGSNRVVIRDTVIGLAFFAGTTALAYYDHIASGKWNELPWELVFNTALFSAFLAEKNCRIQFGMKDISPMGHRFALSQRAIKHKPLTVFNALSVAKTKTWNHLKNLAPLAGIYAVSSTTYVGFNIMANNLLNREKKSTIKNYLMMWPLNFAYFGMWGPSKCLVFINKMKFKTFPAMGRNYVEFMKARVLPKVPQAISNFMTKYGMVSAKRGADVLNVAIDKIGIGLVNQVEWRWLKEGLQEMTTPIPTASEVLAAIFQKNSQELKSIIPDLYVTTEDKRPFPEVNVPDIEERLRITMGIELDDFKFKFLESPVKDGPPVIDLYLSAEKEEIATLKILERMEKKMAIILKESQEINFEEQNKYTEEDKPSIPVTGLKLEPELEPELKPELKPIPKNLSQSQPNMTTI